MRAMVVAAAAMHALAQGPVSLGAYRFLLGIGEAGNWPGAVEVVAEWFPEKSVRWRRACSTAGPRWSDSGASGGRNLMLHYGWRTAFAFVGLAGLLWLAFWGRMYFTPEATVETPKLAPVPVRDLLSSRFLWAFTFSKVFFDSVWYFYIFWFPEYLKRVRHFDLAGIGKVAWIPFMVAGFGNVLGGLLSGYLLRRGWSVTTARKSAVTFFCVLMMSAIPAVLAGEAWLSIAFVSVAMLGYTGGLANMLTIPSGRVSRNAARFGARVGRHRVGFGGDVRPRSRG